jgi:hypothetical protein
MLGLMPIYYSKPIPPFPHLSAQELQDDERRRD